MIRSKPATKESRDGWDAVFGKKCACGNPEREGFRHAVPICAVSDLGPRGQLELPLKQKDSE